MFKVNGKNVIKFVNFQEYSLHPLAYRIYRIKRKISLVAHTLGREHLLSRGEVDRLQGLRGMYGIASPAPICTDASLASDAAQVDCQVVQAPASIERLVAHVPAAAETRSERAARTLSQPGTDEEIRLTYRELTALIEDAVRQLK